MRFIRKNGRIIPIRTSGIDKAPEELGKRAGKVLGKVGYYEKRSKELLKASVFNSKSHYEKARLMGEGFAKRSLHMSIRADQAKSMGMKLGKFSQVASGIKKVSSNKGKIGLGIAAIGAISYMARDKK